MTIGIVILNWNGWKDTVDCVHSLLSISRLNDWVLEICIVDNGSSDTSVAELTKLETNTKTNNINITLIKSEQNEGYTGGNNRGIRYLLGKNCEYILLLNNDTIVDKNFLIYLIETAEKSNASLLSPLIYFAPGYEFHHCAQSDRGKIIWYAGGIIDWNNVYCFHRGVNEIDKSQYDKKDNTDFISGCCMLIKKEIFEKIGLFDEKYFLYLEDVDLCVRAVRFGLSLHFVPKSKIWHKNAQSSDKPGSETHVYYQTRNRLVFGMRYAPFRSKVALIKESLKFIINGGAKRKAVLDFYFRKYGKRK
jgi:hypothetical protein